MVAGCDVLTAQRLLISEWKLAFLQPRCLCWYWISAANMAPAVYKNPGVIEFTAPLIDAGGGGVYVEFPHSVEEKFGVKNRVPIQCTFRKAGAPASAPEAAYRGSMCKMGLPRPIIIVVKALRAVIGVEPPASIVVRVWLDQEERKVEVPGDLRDTLNKAKIGGRSALDVFTGQSYTCQKEYVAWVEDAKQAETRARRIAGVVDKLQEKANGKANDKGTGQGKKDSKGSAGTKGAAAGAPAGDAKAIAKASVAKAKAAPVAKAVAVAAPASSGRGTKRGAPDSDALQRGADKAPASKRRKES